MENTLGLSPKKSINAEYIRNIYQRTLLMEDTLGIFT